MMSDYPTWYIVFLVGGYIAGFVSAFIFIKNVIKRARKSGRIEVKRKF